MILVHQLFAFLSLLTSIIAFVLSVINSKRKDLFQIKLYIILTTAVAAVDIFFYFLKYDTPPKIEQAIINIASIFEISLIYNFLFVRIKRRIFRVWIVIFFMVYLSICAFIWTMLKTTFYSFAPDIFGIEGLLITIPCLFYIYEILKSDLHINLNLDSNFIVTCGLLFYFSVSIPNCFSWYILFYLSPGFDKIIITSNILCFIILNISFMKAYLCPAPVQQQ
jgi:hypothetical protein